MGKKVIVVDDSAPIRQMVAVALSQEGFQMIEAEDGIEGLAKIAKHPDAAIVITDINMPKMNGLDMLEEAHKRGATRAMPFLILTTEGAGTMLVRAKAAGAKGWIVKPFKSDIFVTVVKKLTGTP